MPWEVKSGVEGCDGFAVVKKGGGTKVLGCHPTRGAALKQVRALYANEAQHAAAVDQLADEILAAGEMTYVESQHPRHPAGVREGGRWMPKARLAHERTQTNYYATFQDARDVRDAIANEYPDARVVSYDRGYAVQLEKSGAYFYTPGDETLAPVAPSEARQMFLDRAEGSIKQGLESKSSVERIKAETAQNVIEQIRSGKLIANDDELLQAMERMNHVDPAGPDRSVLSLELDTVTGLALGRLPRKEDLAKPTAPRDIRGPAPGDWEAQARAADQSAQQNADRAAELRSQGNPEHAADYEAAAERARQRADELRSRTAALTASAPIAPPDEWFDDPKLDGPTPLTVTADGRVFGHLAEWGKCHMGIQGACVLAPKSQTGYKHFYAGGRILTASGEMLDVGRLTVGTGHAPLSIGRVAAAAHYDNTGAVVAFVRAGEDEFGPWLAGAVKSDATAEQIRDLRGNPPSGDWRKVPGVGLELVAALAVPVPGYPVAAVTASGDLEALVMAYGDSSDLALVAAIEFDDEHLLRRLDALAALALPDVVIAGMEYLQPKKKRWRIRA